jgi:hypothetical protein
MKKILEFLRSRGPEKNRKFILATGILLLVNYLLFRALTLSNPLDIFPSFPVIDNRENVTVYMPRLHGKDISPENVPSATFEDKERKARFLAKKVLQGSRYENTAILIPVNLLLKKVWITPEGGGTCVLDFQVSSLTGETAVIEGSEKRIKEALTRTLVTNIEGVNRVVFCRQGIPSATLWEY